MYLLFIPSVLDLIYVFVLIMRVLLHTSIHLHIVGSTDISHTLLCPKSDHALLS